MIRDKEASQRELPSRLDQLVERLRACLQEEGARAGERLPSERELAQRFQVTRGDVRRAIGYLAALGVLEVRHGVGAFLARQPAGIASASLELMRTVGSFATWQMFEARRGLETELAALAAARRSPEDLHGIAAQIEGMADSLADPGVFLVHDIRFHRAIAAAAGNPILAALMESIAGALYRERESAVEGEGSRQDALRHHATIYRAIEQQDSASARRAMHDHLVSAERPGTAANDAEQSRENRSLTFVETSVVRPEERTQCRST